MQSWERRLGDLAQSLANCTTSYFDPESFRRNVNHFLTTSRTVTFLIQKVKVQIPDFDAWHSEHVLKPWSNDDVMKWAKEARNFVEKEGDLEINSKLTVTLFWSYFEENDTKIDVGREELVGAGITKLVRIAQKSLPTHVERDSAIKIERRWVTASLPHWELLRALTYVYRRVLECCVELAAHLNIELDASAARSMTEMPDEASFAQYVKLSTGACYMVGLDPKTVDPSVTLPPEIRDAFIRPSVGDKQPPRTLNEVMEYFSGTARATFEYFGNHISILFIFGAEWKLLTFMSVHFEDQTEKYIFWRVIGEKARVLRASGVIWIGELWVREAEIMRVGPPRKGKIIGEQLVVTGVDRDGNLKRAAWEIKRASADEKPTLALTEDTPFDSAGNYLVPVLRAMGIPDSSPIMPRLRQVD
jgi:hypothetical protein